jgi:archaemetzincin
MAFVPPGDEERRRAIGSLDGLPSDLRRAFSANQDFAPLPRPARHDWLAVTRERGQSFERFTRSSSNRPDAVRRRMYLQPVGHFSAEDASLLEQLQRFGSAFFLADLELLPSMELDGTGITTRRNRYTEVLQLLTRDILAHLARSVPDDAWSVLGITRHDLYPHSTWSFVFGEAMLDERVGVFSVARYDPRFYDKPAADPVRVLLRRACKVLAHETCHMLGMLHCTFFNCLMNGTNHLAESDRRPLHLCPVDLRKLHWALGFDIVERYRRLLAFWTDAGVAEEAQWIERRLEFIMGRATGAAAPSPHEST